MDLRRAAPALILAAGLVPTAAAWDLQSEIERTRFASASFGTPAAVLNPAGLAVARDDDGILLNYNTRDTDRDHDERNFLWTMGGLGFSYQKERMGADGEETELDLYQISLGVGGRSLAVGSRVKLLETHDGKGFRRSYDMDLGVLLRPLPVLSLGAMVRNPAGTEIQGPERSVRSFRGGASLMLGRSVILSAEGAAPDSVEKIDDITWRAGVEVSPAPALSLLGGWEFPPTEEPETVWAGAWIHLSGVGLGATWRQVRGESSSRLAAEVRLALRGVAF